MTQSQHTPGPWVVTDAPDAYGNAVFSVMTVDEYSYIYRGLASAYGEANANLIAAAPDMLEALEGISVQLAAMDWENSANWNATCRENAFLLIDNAITKAKGEVAQ